MSSTITLQDSKTPVSSDKQRSVLDFMSPISGKGHNYALHTNLTSGTQIQVLSLNARCTLNSLATPRLLFLRAT